MEPRTLFRLGGLAAIIGGAARIVVAFPVALGPRSAEALYTVIDILFLFGLMAIYFARAEGLGFLGLTAFAIAVAALSFIGGPDADPFGFSTYQQGAAVLAVAMAGLSIAWLARRQGPVWPPLCWLGSLVVGGLVSGGAGFAIAGALFGAGFVAAGVDLLRRPV